MEFRLADRAARDPADLRADSGTVRYELETLLAATERYSKAEVQNDRAGMNVAVGSFAIHCRVLIVFLYGHLDEITAAGKTQGFGKKARENDVFAYD
jgi:hypothetical protein